MNITVRVLCIVLVWVFMQSLLFAATVKKKNGQVINGEIKGKIILKGMVQSRKESLSTKYVVNYSLIGGEYIDAIDEDGIHGVRDGKYLLLIVNQENTPANDVKVFESLTSRLIASKEFSFLPLTENTLLVVAPVNTSVKEGILEVSFDLGKFTRDDVIRIAQDFYGAKRMAVVKQAFEQERLLSEKYKTIGKPTLSWTDKLLGEVRIEGGKGRLIPAIELMTEKGVVTIPVNEIVEFKIDRK